MDVMGMMKKVQKETNGITLLFCFLVWLYAGYISRHIARRLA